MLLVVVLFAACAWTTAHGQAVYPEKMTYVNPTPTAAEIFVNRYRTARHSNWGSLGVGTVLGGGCWAQTQTQPMTYFAQALRFPSAQV